MGATVSGPSITVAETAETITLTAGATNPSSFLRVFGCETMTVTAEAEVTRKLKALDVVPAIGMSGSIRRGAGEDGTGETISFGDSADRIPDTPARWSPTVRKSLDAVEKLISRPCCVTTIRGAAKPSNKDSGSAHS